MTAQTDPRVANDAVRYDALNQVTAIVDPLAARRASRTTRTATCYRSPIRATAPTTYGYGDRDRVTRRTILSDVRRRSPTTRTEICSRRPIGRDREPRSLTTGSTAVSAQLFADGAAATYSYDAVSRLTRADDSADPHRPISFAYDGLDRLVSETTALGTIRYRFDAISRRSGWWRAAQSRCSTVTTATPG